MNEKFRTLRGLKRRVFERAFLREFVENGFFAARAYRKFRPHVSAGSARVMGHRVLRRVSVIERLQEVYGVPFETLTICRGFKEIR